MPSYFPPKKNVQYIFYLGLISQANPNIAQSNPTIASGDFKVSIDGGALANLGTLPTVTPAAGKMVKVTLSTSEMNGDNITFVGSDAAGAEWQDVIVNIQTSAQQIDDLSTQASQNIIDDFLDTEIADIQARLPAALVSGRIDASVGAMASGTVTATAIAADAIGASELAADAVTEIAAGIWDRLTSALTTVGSAGKLLVDNLNATVSSRATQTSVDTVDDFLDTEVAAIKAKTDNLPTDPADASDIAALLTAIDDFVDTEVAAIKAKTDNLPAAPAAVSDIPTAAAIADAIWDEPLTQPSGVFAWAGSFRNLVNWLGVLSRNKILQTDSTTTLRNDADSADLATSAISDDGTTFTRSEWS